MFFFVDERLVSVMPVCDLNCDVCLSCLLKVIVVRFNYFVYFIEENITLLVIFQ